MTAKQHAHDHYLNVIHSIVKSWAAFLFFGFKVFVLFSDRLGNWSNDYRCAKLEPSHWATAPRSYLIQALVTGTLKSLSFHSSQHLLKILQHFHISPLEAAFSVDQRFPFVLVRWKKHMLSASHSHYYRLLIQCQAYNPIRLSLS